MIVSQRFLECSTKDILHLESFTSNIGEWIKGSLLWNTLPQELKGIRSTRLFTKKLKELLQG